MASAVSGMSGRSGRSGLCLTPRIEHGDENSDICAGEGADEFIKRRSAVVAGGFSQGRAKGNGSSAAAGGGGAMPPLSASAGAASGDGRTSSLARRREDDDLSFYDSSSRVQEVEDTFADLPTPVRAGSGATTGGRGSGSVGGRGVVGPDGNILRSQRSDSSEGWVDQYAKEGFPAGMARLPTLKVGGETTS